MVEEAEKGSGNPQRIYAGRTPPNIAKKFQDINKKENDVRKTLISYDAKSDMMDRDQAHQRIKAMEDLADSYRDVFYDIFGVNARAGLVRFDSVTLENLGHPSYLETLLKIPFSQRLFLDKRSFLETILVLKLKIQALTK